MSLTVKEENDKFAARGWRWILRQDGKIVAFGISEEEGEQKHREQGGEITFLADAP